MGTNQPSGTAEKTPTRTGTGVDIHRLTAAVETAGRYAWAGRAGTWPLRQAWLDVTHEGRENVPSEGGVLLAANHLAFIDSLLVMYALPRPVSFLGKSEYLDHPLTRRVFPATGMLPLDRSGRLARITLDRAASLLEQGGIVGVHPEGTRSRDGMLGPGHRGIAQLALRTGVPVVPVGIIGTGEAQPVGQLLPDFRADITIKFGAPIGLGRWSGARRSAQSRRELTNEIMDSIAALTGQARRDEADTATERQVATVSG